MSQPLVDLTGRHVVITGGAGGLGRAVADVFAAASAQISLLDLSGPDTEAVAAKITAAGGQAAGRACDVTDPEQVAAAFDWAGVVQPKNFRVDAWVTPPAYTAKPPVILPGVRAGEPDRQGVAHAVAALRARGPARAQDGVRPGRAR